MSIEELLKRDPFKVGKGEKQNIIKEKIKALTYHHFKFCKEYKKILESTGFKFNNFLTINDTPYLRESHYLSAYTDAHENPQI